MAQRIWKLYMDTLGVHNQPPWRFLLTAGIVTAGVYVIRPDTMYDSKTGAPRPWVYLDDGSGVPATEVPWWMPGAVLGSVGALFF